MEKVALVTGCSSGIGFETSLELARNGYFTYASMRNVNSGNELQTIAQTAGLNLKIIEVDVTKEETIKKAIEQIESEKGRIDVLVNNAGYGIVGSIENVSVEEIKENMDTDFFGPIRMVKAVVPIMRKNGGGRIINISSLSGRIGFGFSSSYSCSKFALEGLSECMRLELAPFGIITTLIEPGVVKTKFHEKMKVASNAKNDPLYKETTEKIMASAKDLFERGMSPKKVAEKIVEVLKSDNPEVRYAVGLDAELMMEERKRKTDLQFENYVKDMFSEVLRPKSEKVNQNYS